MAKEARMSVSSMSLFASATSFYRAFIVDAGILYVTENATEFPNNVTNLETV